MISVAVGCWWSSTTWPPVDFNSQIRAELSCELTNLSESCTFTKLHSNLFVCYLYTLNCPSKGFYDKLLISNFSYFKFFPSQFDPITIMHNSYETEKKIVREVNKAAKKILKNKRQFTLEIPRILDEIKSSVKARYCKKSNQF